MSLANKFEEVNHTNYLLYFQSIKNFKAIIILQNIQTFSHIYLTHVILNKAFLIVLYRTTIK